MEAKVAVLGFRSYKSPKTQNVGYYVSLSVNGQGKRVYMREAPLSLQFVPNPSKPGEFVPSDGCPVLATMLFSLGGYGETLGVDVSALTPEA